MNHIETTLMDCKSVPKGSNSADKMVDFDKFGEAILRACKGLTQSEVREW